MKATKHFSIIAIIAIIALAIIGCKGDDDTTTGGTQEQPIERPAEKITFGTDNTLSTMVSSTKPLTDEQWATVKSKLTTALGTASKSGEQLITNCIGLFGTMGVNIRLEEAQGYSYYKIDVDTKSILFNANYVINTTEDDLLLKVKVAVNAAGGDGPLTD